MRCLIPFLCIVLCEIYWYFIVDLLATIMVSEECFSQSFVVNSMTIIII